MNTVTVMLAPVPSGWKIELSDGRKLAQFTGLAAKRRALQHLATLDPAEGPADGH